MKSFQFGDTFRAIYPSDAEAPGEPTQAALYAVLRSDNGSDAPSLAMVNPLVPLKGASADAVINVGESFTAGGVAYQSVADEGFALGFDKV